MKWHLLVPVFVISILAGAQNSRTQKVKRDVGPPALGIHWAKGVPHATTTGSPNMLWHNGDIMVSSTIQAIYWGTSWGDPAFVADKISGLDTWYVGYSNSNYAKTSDEYTGANGKVGPSLSYLGHFVDTSKASGGNNTSSILAEVCKIIPNPVANGYYPVYIDQKRKGNYCAYHSWGACGSTPVQFAFFWNLDGDAGCDPQDTRTVHSQGLAALSNVSGHELSEARTDPRDGGWYDSAGAENADKCSWTFNVPFVTFSNKSTWKIQGEWSNAAYNSGTGYPNRSGLKGCLDGH